MKKRINILSMMSCIGVIIGCIVAGCASTSPKQVSEIPGSPEVYFDRSFGSCPAYTVIFYADGRARYTGKSNVDSIGVFEGMIDAPRMMALINAFDRSGFSSMNDIYDDNVTDVATRTVRYRRYDSTKTVTDRFNTPPELRALESTIDSVAATIRWRKVAELPEQ
jgi:hypothetical protein